MTLDTQIKVALIAAVVSILLAILNFLLSRHSQKYVEKLKAEIDENKAERNARRDYEYDARKRLYEQYEPLFFQLTECSEVALDHIQSLAERASKGDLDENGWLSKNSYYLKATIYKLLVPIAMFKLVHKRLTLVDLQVDAKIHSQYFLAKTLYYTFTEDFVFARLYKKLVYDPYCLGWAEKRKTNPQVYRRQGIPVGRLDNALESLIVEDNNGSSLIISFGRFEEVLDNVNVEDVSSALGVARDVFFSFHPQTRPVLWRILICQAKIYGCILKIRYASKCDASDLREIFDTLCSSEEERRKYEWRRDNNEEDDGKVLNEPFEVARSYLMESLAKPYFSHRHEA